MKTTLILTAAILGLAMMLFSGCYTQVATNTESGQNASANPNDSSYVGGYNSGDNNNYYYDDDWNHTHVGFSYYYPPSDGYYPSDYYGAAYVSPWSFSVGFGWGYYPYYGYAYPYYGYGYYPYYPYYGYGYGYGYCSPYYYNQSVRTYGSSRLGAPTRGTIESGGRSAPGDNLGNSSDIYGRIPVGAALQGGAAQPVGRTGNNVNSTAPRTGSSRVGAAATQQNSRTAPQRYRDGRVTSSRGSMGRAPVPRSGQYQAGPHGYFPPSAPSSGQVMRNGAPRSGSPQGGRGMSAPPSGGRGMSAPPPSGGGHSAPAHGGGGRR